MRVGMLIILGGLPAAGKSTLSAILARDLPAIHLRIDTVEQACRQAGYSVSGPEGYEICGAIAQDNLRLGHDVIVDSVNPIAWTRTYWRSIAELSKVPFTEVEIVCTDSTEHRRRAESRRTDIEGLQLPDWQKIQSREYETWDEAWTIDTAHQTAPVCAERLRDHVTHAAKNSER